jgi:hypothetical protein
MSSCNLLMSVPRLWASLTWTSPAELGTAHEGPQRSDPEIFEERGSGTVPFPLALIGCGSALRGVGPNPGSDSTIVEAAHTVLSGLRDGDRLAVLASRDTPKNCKPRLVAALSSDFDTVERQITGEITQGNSGSTACQILGGIRGAAQPFLLQPRADRRRAIVAITDEQGAETASRLVHNGGRDLTADAVVLGVIVHSGNTTVWLGAPHRGACYAAEVTSGDTLDRDDAVEGLRQIIRRHRLRYSLLRDAPRNTGEERIIRVKQAVIGVSGSLSALLTISRTPSRASSSGRLFHPRWKNPINAKP